MTPRIKALELPADLQWLNTRTPVTLASQRGRIVLLDFWTYCCVNCLHVIPDLRYVKERYPTDVCVIGIHSPKFPNEAVTSHVQKAINRYGIQHPVANDPCLRVWQQYSIHAWPTVVVIDAEGMVVEILSGEGHRDRLEKLVQSLLTAEGAHSYTPSPIPVAFKPEVNDGVLSFPGKVLATEDAVYVSDSGHCRLLQLSVRGEIEHVWGSGIRGLRNGDASSAQFNNPQGMVLVDGHLLVADTDNHCVRSIQLQTGMVKTIAGTGELGRTMPSGGRDACNVALNSPWALAESGGIVFIAMAGNHQIWCLHLSSHEIYPWMGSGAEGLVDGKADSAAFAQPSGVAVVGQNLYVVDAESSAIRQIHLAQEKVTTLVGIGLFDYGDVDGVLRACRLQHPMCLTYDPEAEVLWVADAYNHKIKKLNIHTGMVSNFPIPLSLDEPGGVSVVGQVLWIADTNHHRLLKLNTRTGETKVMMIRDLREESVFQDEQLV